MAFENDKGPLFLWIFGMGSAIAILATALRFWVRARIVRKVGPDDWIMLSSLVLNLGAFSCLTVSVHHGLGKHYQDLAPTASRMALKLLWTALCITPSAEATAKISITVMLIRITTSKKWKMFLQTLILLFTLITIVTLFGVLLPCRPVELLWDRSVKGSCNQLAEAVIFYMQGVTASLYDIILATTPIALLWKAQINVWKKAIVCGLLAIGYFTSIACILRTVYTPGALRVSDITYSVMDFMIWKTIELPLSIIVGCLPTLQPLSAKYLGFGTNRMYRVQDDTYPLTDGSKAGTIKQTTSITINRSTHSHDGKAAKKNMRDVDDWV